MIYHLPIPVFLGLLFLFLAFQLYRRGFPPAAVLALGLAGAALLLFELRGWLRRQREAALAREEETASRTAAGMPIEPEAGGPIRLRALLVIPLVLVVLFLEFPPFRDEVLAATPWRIVRAPRGCARPLQVHDDVLVRLGRDRPRRGSVVWMGPVPRGERGTALGTVLAIGPDTARGVGRVTVIENGEESVVSAASLYDAEIIVPVAADSFLLIRRAGLHDEPEVLERRALADVRGVGVAVLYPPHRWRRLP